MSDETPYSDARLMRLAEEIDRPPDVRADNLHLSDEECVEYSTDALAPEALARAEAHLRSCDDCLMRLEHLIEVSDHWQNDAGVARLHALSARISAPLVPPAASLARITEQARRWWESLTTEAGGHRFPLQFASSTDGALAVHPSSLHFGGTQSATTGASDIFHIGPATAYPLTALYMANGRELPDEAEVFWGHEIWLVLVPCSAAIGAGRDVRSIGVALGIATQDAHIVDIWPRHDPASEPSDPDRGADGAGFHRVAVDLGWTGVFERASADRRLEAAGRQLAFGEELQLAKDTGSIGRLVTAVFSLPIDSASVGLHDAQFVFAAGGVSSAMGSLWLTVVTDKHNRALDLRAQPWFSLRGVNGTPARLAADAARLTVTLADGVG